MSGFDAAQVGQRVQAQRKQRGLAQGELARLVHVRQATISDLENGQSAGLRAKTLYDIARALGATTDYLLGMPDARPTPTLPG